MRLRFSYTLILPTFPTSTPYSHLFNRLSTQLVNPPKANARLALPFPHLFLFFAGIVSRQVSSSQVGTRRTEEPCTTFLSEEVCSKVLGLSEVSYDARRTLAKPLVFDRPWNKELTRSCVCAPQDPDRLTSMVTAMLRTVRIGVVTRRSSLFAMVSLAILVLLQLAERINALPACLPLLGRQRTSSCPTDVLLLLVKR